MAITKLAPKKRTLAKATPRRSNALQQTSRTAQTKRTARPMTRAEAGRLGAEARWGRPYPAKSSRSSSRTEARRPILGKRSEETRRNTRRPLSRIEREERSLRRPTTANKRSASKTSRPTLRNELQKRSPQSLNRNSKHDFNFEIDEDAGVRGNRGRQAPSSRATNRRDSRTTSNERRPSTRSKTRSNNSVDPRDCFGRFSNPSRRNYR